jgi:23S rRNA pseudouridine2605 synthase
MNPYPFIWLALNKPGDVITTRNDPQGRKTVYEFLPQDLPRVEAVGRLDRASTGLLLFTNDFKLSQKLLDPENEVPRTYQVVTDAALPENALRGLREGVTLEDGTSYQSVRWEKIPGPAAGRSYRFILHEGKNREIRKLIEYFGRRVRGLHRLDFGPVLLGDLRCGKTRLLASWEVDRLRKRV